MTREEAKECNKNMSVTIKAVDNFIDEIYDDFESRMCENCKHMNRNYKISEWQTDTHFKCESLDVIIDGLDFGCNKFKRKEE